MTTEIERAHQLLVSSEEALERSRNRPTRLLTATTDEPRFTKEGQETIERMAAESVRRMAEHTAKRTMSKETQAGWDKWAKSIASNAAHERYMALVEEIAEVLTERDERAALLEQRIAVLEQQLKGKVSPIRSAA